MFFWMAWFYLIVPLLSFGAWLLGANVIQTELIIGLQIDGLSSKMHNYGPPLIVLVSILLAWAITSWFRFSGADRRQSPKLPSLKEVADANGISPEVLTKLRRSKNVTLPKEFLDHVFNAQEAAKPSSRYRGKARVPRKAAEVINVTDFVRNSTVPASIETAEKEPSRRQSRA